MQETQAEPLGLAGAGQTDQQIRDPFVLSSQLRAIEIASLADPKGPTGQGYAHPASRHRIPGHLAPDLQNEYSQPLVEPALRWVNRYSPRPRSMPEISSPRAKALVIWAPLSQTFGNRRVRVPVQHGRERGRQRDPACDIDHRQRLSCGTGSYARAVQEPLGQEAGPMVRRH